MQVVKTLEGFACAHRQHAAASHCRFVHGYERSFRLIIEGPLDPETGWVIDFGSFKELHKTLADQFDHTLIVAEDDPLLPSFKELDAAGGCRLRVMDHPGMEGAARWVWEVASKYVSQLTDGRAKLVEVEAREADRNAVRFRAQRHTRSGDGI